MKTPELRIEKSGAISTASGTLLKVVSFMTKKIAIVGGGPSSLFLYRSLLAQGASDFSVDIFEKEIALGCGMPYSRRGANIEHVTNVSGNEIPDLVTSLADWIATLDDQILNQFGIKKDKLVEFRVLPRLLFGRYLAYQFDQLLEVARKRGLKTCVLYETEVSDISAEPGGSKMTVHASEKHFAGYDHVIICTGHHWPRSHENCFQGYYDSPYPPSKLQGLLNHAVAIRGSSLTAIDAIRTLGRSHGIFSENEAGHVAFTPRQEADDFKIVLHARNGLLPAIRFHLEDSHLSKGSLLSAKEIDQHIAQNAGYLSLDFIFEKDFKDSFREKEPLFYESIKGMQLEEFVEAMMSTRERMEPFQLFKIEYAEAKSSIKRKKSIYWKERLALLSFAMNYPAKHFSAEDMLRLQQTLMPLISVVIAFAPQNSCEEVIALHDAGRLELISVGHHSRVEPHQEGGITYHYADESGGEHQTSYKTFIDCIGQPHLMLKDFPFKTLVEQNVVTPARLKFRTVDQALRLMNEGNENVVCDNGEDYYLKVPGLAINDAFQTVNSSGVAHPGVYIMAVPYIGGYNPDYSGLDFCEEAAKRIVGSIFKEPVKE